QEKKVDIEILKDIVKAGFQSPSAFNQQTKSFVIVTDKKQLLDLSQVSNNANFLKNTNAVIVLLGSNTNNVLVPQMQDQDLSSSITTMALYARSLNIASCWIGVFPIEDRMLKAGKILSLDESRFVHSILALGYPINDKEFEFKDKTNENEIYFERVK
ncbi:MAG: nitroreductase family protein, partial [Anaeroplasmataceae bacterium]